WTAVLVLGQALLLLVPIDIAQGRPARRRLFVPVITAALLFACIVTGAIFSLLCAVFGDKALNYLDTVSSAQAVQNPVAAQVMRQLGVGSGTGLEFFLGVAGILFAVWLLWAAVFHRFAYHADPDAL